jgi:MFS family permease
MQPSSSESVAPAARSAGTLPTIGGAYFALAVLFAMNLLNYVDRYSFFAVGKQIEQELRIEHLAFGWLGTAFMVVYTLASPLTGWLGDRYHRRALLSGGVALWSVATVATAFATDYWHMFVWRAVLGIGEASYGVIAPALLADVFPISKRGRAMGIYYLALPLGTALGYMTGGAVGSWLGWRPVFLVVGLPGLVAALAALLIEDPGRGASEGGASAPSASHPRLKEYLEFFRTKTFLYNTAGMAAVTFATGAYVAFGSIFYQEVRGLSLWQTNVGLGALLALAGLIGIALGTFLADLGLRITRRAYLLLAAVVVAAAIPPGVGAILDPEQKSSLSLLFVASVLMAMVLGPSNTVTANVVPAQRRAAGFALFIFLIHVFGDIASPPLLGWISHFFGRPDVAASPIGQFFASIGAKPVAGPQGASNLTVAMLAVAPVLALGCVFFLLGSRHLARDEEKARAAGAGGSEEGDLARFHH